MYPNSENINNSENENNSNNSVRYSEGFDDGYKKGFFTTLWWFIIILVIVVIIFIISFISFEVKCKKNKFDNYINANCTINKTVLDYMNDGHPLFYIKFTISDTTITGDFYRNYYIIEDHYYSNISDVRRTLHDKEAEKILNELSSYKLNIVEEDCNSKFNTCPISKYCSKYNYCFNCEKGQNNEECNPNKVIDYVFHECKYNIRNGNVFASLRRKDGKDFILIKQ